jgi:hypothetical protein
MHSTMNTPSKLSAAFGAQTDTTKLVSLLALAAGATAMPQTALADIIYTDLNSEPKMIGFLHDPSFIFTLPGTALMGFERRAFVTYTTLASITINYRTVLAGDRGGAAPVGIRANANFFAAPLPQGATWDQAGVGTAIDAFVGTASDSGGITPSTGYDRQYLAWVFTDSTQGDQLRYGWAEVSLAVAGYNAGGPTVTVWGYAYDNTGAKPTMGQTPVPEPTSGALMIMGAMALGARGLRQWRQNRPPVDRV